jgi:hypothetical protein
MKLFLVSFLSVLLSQSVFARVDALLQCNSPNPPLFQLTSQLYEVNGVQEKFSVKTLFFSTDNSAEKVVVVDDPRFSKFEEYLNSRAFSSKFLTIRSELKYDGVVEFEIYYGTIQPKDDSKSEILSWSNYNARISESQSSRFNLNFPFGKSWAEVLVLNCIQSVKFK